MIRVSPPPLVHGLHSRLNAGPELQGASDWGDNHLAGKPEAVSTSAWGRHGEDMVLTWGRVTDMGQMLKALMEHMGQAWCI